MSKTYVSGAKLAFRLLDHSLLFENICFDLAYGEKVALIGENGVGKSTLLKIITGALSPSCGSVCRSGEIAFLDQNINQISGSIARVLGIETRLKALLRIANGCAQSEDWELAGEDWNLQDRISQSLVEWGLSELSLDDDFALLSGGEKEKILIIGSLLSASPIIILDEPTNNLDQRSRALLYQKILEAQQGILIISHDRDLLKQMGQIWEMTPQGIERFGGNYDFYKSEKQRQRQNSEALATEYRQEKQKIIAQQMDLQQKSARKNNYGEKQVANRRYSRMAGRAMQIQAESTKGDKTLKLASKLAQKNKELYDLELALKEELIKIPLPPKPFIRDRLLEIKELEFGYNNKKLFQKFDLVMRGDERVAICGDNGCGKSTLLRLILGRLEPDDGSCKLNGQAVYLNQDLSLLDPELPLIESIIKFNPGISRNDAHRTLANFKFRNISAEKITGYLSGGEMLRACLAAIFCTAAQPDIIILDEPTNNLDIKSIEILESSLAQYQGALLVISHDRAFLQNIKISRQINL